MVCVWKLSLFCFVLFLNLVTPRGGFAPLSFFEYGLQGGNTDMDTQQWVCVTKKEEKQRAKEKKRREEVSEHREKNSRGN